MKIQKVAYLIIITTFAQLISCKKPIEMPEVKTDFNSSESQIFIGQTINFRDNSTGNTDRWTWDFEGGTPSTSTQEDPIIQYDNEGEFSVSLVSANEQNSNSIKINNFVKVYLKLQADFSFEDSIINESTEIKFKNTSTGTSPSFEWNFEGGIPSISSEAAPLVMYSSPGIYKATLKITNNFETTGSSKTIEIVVLPTSNLTAFYPFKGNANDESGNNLDGNVIGAILTSDRHGKENKAYYFDGVNSRIEISNNDLFESESYTISSWVNIENGTGAIISLSNFNPVYNNCGYYLSILNGNIRGFSNISTSNWSKLIYAKVLPQNEWRHIAFSFDGQKQIIYLDGEEAASVNQPHNVNYIENNPVQIGSYATQSGATAFKGKLDNIRIFSRALSPSEVMALAKE